MLIKRCKEIENLLEKSLFTLEGKLIKTEVGIESFHLLLQKVKKSQGIVYVVGNGGSAGIASHFSVDLINAMKVPSQTLYDSNTMTCISNDYGYEYIFEKQLDLLLRKEDLLVAISSSGKSQNICKAATIANRMHVPVVTISGFSESNPLRSSGKLNFWVDSEDYGLVETAHFFFLHYIVDSWKRFLLSQSLKLEAQPV